MPVIAFNGLSLALLSRAAGRASVLYRVAKQKADDRADWREDDRTAYAAKPSCEAYPATNDKADDCADD